MRPSELNPFFVPLSEVSGVGPKSVKLYERVLGNEPALKLHLLMHVPHRLVDRRLRSLSQPFQDGEVATFKLEVHSHQPPPKRSRAPYRVVMGSGGQTLTLIFFSPREDYLLKILPLGEVHVVSGRLQTYDGHWQMPHPDFIVTEQEFAALPPFEPIYPLTAGLTNKAVRKLVASLWQGLPRLEEWLGAETVGNKNWPDFLTALKSLHTPTDANTLSPQSPAVQRLAYDEFLANQLALAIIRSQQRKGVGRSFGVTQRDLASRLIDALPYTLTGAQQNALKDIYEDLQDEKRMLRLVQGDVGSGKTAVALLAMARVVENGAQAAIMAPTEILARQHFESMQPLCNAVGIRLGILVGKDSASSKRAVLSALKNGEIDIAIGTHALFQKGVEFADLGLAVVDEQHRFGVHQRLALANKANMGAELLVMTATPIPRTLVLTYFGDMDVSRIDEKPPGRKPIDTRVISQEKLTETVQGLKRKIEAGEQAYWVCPLVDESEVLPITSVEERYESLKSIFGAQVDLLHGRMSSEEKQIAMERFERGETRILIATTVIEVGVNVPNATIMIIEHAERFGLSQLHQLRGRVGRGDKPSTCLLMYGQPLTKTGKSRLEIMRSTEDGFVIAEEDLRLRGEGEVLGTRQSGEAGFKLADVAHHKALLEMARDDARLVLNKDPALTLERGRALRNLLYLFERDQAVQLISAG